VASSWNADDDKDMDNMAKSLAKSDKTVSAGQVAAMFIKSKYLNES